MREFKHPLATIIGLIMIGVVIGVVMTGNFQVDSRSFAQQSAGSVYTESNIQPVQNSNPAMANFNPNLQFTGIAKKVRPSIVSVYTQRMVEQRNPFHYFMPDDENHRNVPQQGQGSGIIISDDGYIITNNHVIEGMEKIRIQLDDNSEYDAELIGRDPKTDIALVKINAEELPYAVLGNSDNTEIGEWVLAIGSPLGLRSTVTAGIVSAIGRNVNILPGSDAIENFIQTDAAINPGNSGGALVNLNGEVIGVNTAIATRPGFGQSSYIGYGFAVPINIAKSVVDDIMKFGEVKRGYLGVYIKDVNPVTAEGVGLDKPRGVLVTGMVENGAAADAGIEPGDVILTVNGQEVNKSNELQARIGTFNPGQEVNLEIWREGDKIRKTVTLRGQGGETALSSREPVESKKNHGASLGLDLRDLSKEQQEMLNLDGGVVVADVENFSAASEADIYRGDVITEVDKEKIKSVDDFNTAIESHNRGEVVRLKIRNKVNEDNLDRLVFLKIPGSQN